MMFFRKAKIPAITNAELKKAVATVKGASSKRVALRKAFELVTDKYKGYRFRTYIYFWRALEKDPNKLWERSGFMHCTQQNYMVRVLLVKSGWFKEEDFDLGFSLVWYISPHQHLKVKVRGKMTAIDPWNYRFGAKMGECASGFGYKNLG